MVKPFNWFKTKIMIMAIHRVRVGKMRHQLQILMSRNQQTLQFRQKIKRYKLTALGKNLDVTGGPDLVDIDRLCSKKIQRQATQIYFFDGKHWQSLTNKRSGEFLASNTLIERFGIKSVLNLDETPPASERSLNAATKLRRELPNDIEMGNKPLMKLSSLLKGIHIKTRETSQNTDIDMEHL